MMATAMTEHYWIWKRSILAIALAGAVLLSLVTLSHLNLNSLSVTFSGQLNNHDARDSAGAVTPSAGAKTWDEAKTTRFVFLVGLEGSGHHFYRELFKISPASARLKKLGLGRAEFSKLSGELFGNKSHNAAGLFSAPCVAAKKQKELNFTSLVGAVAKRLRKFDTLAQNEPLGMYKGDTSIGPNTVPLNAVPGIRMLSYPTGEGDCRVLQYPSLHDLYTACEEAGVSCQHIILTRDPYSVIRSTTMNRNFNNGTARGIRLYSTMLNVIHAQMLHFPGHLTACMEYGAVAEERVGALLGWHLGDNSNKSYAESYASIFRAGGNMTETEKLKIVPPELGLLISDMEERTERVRKTCREMLEDKY